MAKVKTKDKRQKVKGKRKK